MVIAKLGIARHIGGWEQRDSKWNTHNARCTSIKFIIPSPAFRYRGLAYCTPETLDRHDSYPDIHKQVSSFFKRGSLVIVDPPVRNSFVHGIASRWYS